MKVAVAVLSWLLALACVGGAVREINLQSQQAIQRTADLQTAQREPKLAPLALAEYRAIEKTVVVYGSLSLTASAKGLSVASTSLSDYAAWRLTLDRILLETPGVSWKIDYMCSGVCASGLAHQASIHAERRSLPF
jgi:hypothetical protein